MKQSNSLQKSKESKYFDELRTENFDDTFPATDSWLRNINLNLNKKKSEGKLSHMKNYFAAHKFRLAYAFLILAFVVAACNYPVTQQETAGDVLKWSVSKDNTEAISKIENLDWFKNGEYNINEDGNFMSYSLVIPKENHSGLQDYNKQLEAIAGVDMINIIPLNETVERPVYSAFLNDLFKIDINAENMSDAELSKEIDAQLKNAGIENAEVLFYQGSSGKREIKMVIPEQEIKKDSGFDMTIKDGENVNRIKNIRKINPDDASDRFKGKSDEEIREMIKADMGNPDLKDDDIDITRSGDKVQVRINFKKSDGNFNGEWEIENKGK
ncbi:MAG: hypothetical protein IPL53_19970 [Ignavibacteria bacterium]|nr:hypothetical protein [Ignavibacteria bacterium]